MMNRAIGCGHPNYGASVRDNSRSENVSVFLKVFDKIDSNGGGSIDKQELYNALDNAGNQLRRIIFNNQ